MALSTKTLYMNSFSWFITVILTFLKSRFPLQIVAFFFASKSSSLVFLTSSLVSSSLQSPIAFFLFSTKQQEWSHNLQFF